MEDRIVSRNKKARFKFNLLTRFEAGLVLCGSEVKSLRMGAVSFEDAHVIIRNGEVYLRSLHIAAYGKARDGGHVPMSERKLLLKRSEIKKLAQRIESKGMTIVPTMIYFKDGWAKVEIALALGKRQYDKRHAIMERDQKRDMERFQKERRGHTGR